jgi:hypothetical protein
MTALSALSLLRLCQTRGVELVPDGGRIILRGPKAARDQLRSLVADHKMGLLAVLKAPPTPSTTALPPDQPGQEWHRDWRGMPVNLFGLRKPQGGPQ